MADNYDPNTEDNFAFYPYEVYGSADLSIEKSVMKDELCLGAYGLYEIVVTNDGPSDALGVVVTDTLPAGLVYGGGSPECSVMSQTVTCNIGTLPAGDTYDLLIGYNISDTVVGGTLITNTASVFMTGPIFTEDPEPFNNTSAPVVFEAVQW